MIRYAIQRLLQFIPTIIAVSLIIFILLNILPGSAARMSLDPRKTADPIYIENFNKKWGLDKPLYVQYLKYMGNALKGDFGKSYLRGEPVFEIIADRIWPTLKLSIFALGIAVGIGLPLGFIAAIRNGGVLDTASVVGAVAGVSIPQFWLGILLMYLLAVKFSLLPTSGYGGGDLRYIILPAITMGIPYMALLTRTARSAVLNELSMDYIRTARSKGMTEARVNRKHMMPNTMILVLTTIGLQFGSLIGDTVIVEKLFSWPGIGSLLIDSIFQRDIPVTQGCVMVIVTAFLIINLSVDLLYALIDPRIKYK